MEILNLFAEFLEKQDMLSKLTENEKLHSYGYSEIHVIASIGDMKQPNVTGIAQKLHLSRGAVSKITKKLITTGMIDTYMVPPNNQKIFFRLTEKGLFLYKEHEKRHQMWLERDEAFLKQFTEKQRKEIFMFMTRYNIYLEEKIQEIGGKADGN